MVYNIFRFKINVYIFLFACFQVSPTPEKREHTPRSNASRSDHLSPLKVKNFTSKNWTANKMFFNLERKQDNNDLVFEYAEKLNKVNRERQA